MDYPKDVRVIMEKLSNAGYAAYVVGGCVRDALRGIAPKDWDVTTDATPDAIQKLFPESFYENEFGTVGVKTGSDDPALAVVEVTTFRIEETYSDKRHPDAVRFAKDVSEDLARRDFTVNALASDLSGAVTDPYGGRKDLDAKVLRAVGDPEKRFAEDALRMMRAVRFAAELDFVIEERTALAVQKNVAWLAHVSRERVRDEFSKLVMAKEAGRGVRAMAELGLLHFTVPELEEGIDVGQNKHHIYSVFEHNVRALEYAAKKAYTLDVRLASLLHDVGKPRTKRGDGQNATFYGHDVVGGRMAGEILEQLKFPRKTIDKVVTLVRYHLFYYNVGEVTESSVRRLLKNVGPENIEDLVRVREADRIGSGVPKAVPYKLRHFQYMVDKVSRDPISTSMLAIDGNDVMRLLGLEPGPKVGLVLNALLGEVLDDPKKNVVEYLEGRAREFGEKSADDLRQYLEMKERKIEEEEEAARRKYYV